AILVLLSTIVYLIHYFIFGDARHIFIYLVGDIAFVFIEVLLVMMVLHRLLHYRDKQALLKKLNMIIGTFFTEMGTDLLKKLSDRDRDAGKITDQLVVSNSWSKKKFMYIGQKLKRHTSRIEIKKSDLADFKIFLAEKRQFLLNLLENPNLLEHESFSDLLWAIFHLTDELALTNWPIEIIRKRCRIVTLNILTVT
ncbi:MAG: hypothetical protein ABH858_03525, partial [Candidatus Omnitrophota bacterium]